MNTASCFDDNYNIVDQDLKYPESADKIRKILLSEKKVDILNDTEKEVFEIYSSPYERTIIESLLLSDDATIEEIINLTEISEEIIGMYIDIFFSPRKRIGKKLKMIGYIENGIKKSDDIDDQDLRNFFLFKKWVISLGKEFVIWKFSLVQSNMDTGTLYNTVVKEAFFYHKEKSLSDNNISINEYLKSANTLLSGLKTREDIAGSKKEDSSTEFLENLDIIIEEKLTENNIYDDNDDFCYINNIDIVSKKEIENEKKVDKNE